MSDPDGKRATYHLRGWLVEAIKEIQATEGISEIEAVRTLCKYGRYLRNAAQESGTRVLIERDGRQIEVTFL